MMIGLNEPAVQAAQVTKTFPSGGGEITVLHQVDVTVAKGEVVLLMGPSGSGKTTFLSIMGCIMRASHGSVRIMGREVAGLSEAELARVRLDHIGFVFQQYNLFPTLSALENVLVALDLKGVKGAAAVDRARSCLESVGLGDRLAFYPASLSGGQKQRLAIARSLSGDPDVILADEPTAALDSASGKNVMHILRGLALEQGRAVVVVTHDIRLLDFADRIVHMEDGRIEPSDAPVRADSSAPRRDAGKAGDA